MKRTASLLFALLSVATYAQVDGSRTVLSVNGEDVKGLEYYHRMEYLPNVGRQMGNSYANFPPGFLTIEQIITEKLVLQLAKSKGLLPTDAELQAEMNTRLTDDPRYVEDWLLTGQTRADLEYQVKLQLTQFKLQSRGVNITDQEIDQYYKDNPGRFSIPKRYSLRVIAADTDDLRKQVDAALAAGTPFAQVATQFSIELSKANGGDVGTLPESELSQQVRDSVQATKIGQTTVWIMSDGYGVKFLVQNVLAAQPMALDAKLRRTIRREMMLQRGSVKNDVRAELNAFRKTAKIDIKQKEFADAYTKFISAYLKEQSAGRGN